MAAPEPGRRVRLSDFNSIPDMEYIQAVQEWEAEQEAAAAAATNGAAGPELQIVPLAEFAAATEDVAVPLVGTPDETLLPAGGLLLMYGDGGAGKTTLSVDAVAHLAAGQPWLGIPVAAPVRCLLIENEGPRGPFRRRLAAKLAAWQGAPYAHMVHVLEEPWSQFTLTSEPYRAQLARQVGELEVGLVVVGPLATLGARGSGTPDEINDFNLLVQDLRGRTGQQFAMWIVHHENKAGDVSGAWERYPDSLVHVQAQGNGHTRIHWRKVRWSSELHGTSSTLTWAEGLTYELDDKPARDYRAEILGGLEDGEWHIKTPLAKALQTDIRMLQPHLDALLEAGEIAFRKGAIGPSNAQCYRLQSAMYGAQPELYIAPEREAPTGPLCMPRPPIGERGNTYAGQGDPGPTADAPANPIHSGPSIDADIPF